MVIDGKSLVHAMTGEARGHFGELALRCRAVVCCRMSPMQKAEVCIIVEPTAEAFPYFMNMYGIFECIYLPLTISLSICR